MTENPRSREPCTLVVQASSNSIFKLENDLAATLAACRMSYGRLRFAQWISFLHFRLQQTAFRHLEQVLKRFHSLSRRCVVVPFVDPNTTEAEVFENKQTVGDFKRLQTHRSVSNQR